MTTISLSRGATEYLKVIAGTPQHTIETMTAETASVILESWEMTDREPDEENGEIWNAYAKFHNLDPKQSYAKFINSKFCREN